MHVTEGKVNTWKQDLWEVNRHQEAWACTSCLAMEGEKASYNLEIWLFSYNASDYLNCMPSALRERYTAVLLKVEKAYVVNHSISSKLLEEGAKIHLIT